MLIETKPNIKIVKLSGLTTDTNFDVPAMHWIAQIHAINRDTGSEDLTIKNGGSTISSGINAGPTSWDFVEVNHSSALFDSLQTLTVHATDWTNIEADVLIVLMDLSV